MKWNSKGKAFSPSWLVACVLVMLLAPVSIVTPAAAKPRSAISLDRMLRTQRVRGFSGAVLVARGRTTILDKAYGAERNVPVRPNTRFWIASAGKQFTSAAILKCQEKALLRLDDPISRFFPDMPSDKRAITVRQLLAHLSGLDQSYVSEGVADRQTAVDRMLAEKVVDQPGRRFHYSNSNYQLAVAIVEIVSGQPYRDFIRDKLWRPAGLRDSGFSGDAGARLVAPASDETPRRLASVTWGGEGVYSTTHDLLRWYRALRKGRILSPSSVEQLFAPVTPIEEGQAALGWFIGHSDQKQTRIFTRGNEGFGPNALIYAYPKSGTVIIVLTHAGNESDELSWSRFVHAKIEKLLSL
jgi:CubicO group peptidase (beta-lactamase class C family)